MKVLDHPARRQPAADYVTALAQVRRALERHAQLDPSQASPPDPEPLPEILPAGGTEPASALARLCRIFGLSSFERDVLMLCAGMELDATFAPLCAKAQANPEHDYPTFGLALAALPGAGWQALLPDAPLRYWQLVRLEPGANLTTGRISIDERVLHDLLGFASRDERLAGFVEPVDEALELVPSHQRLARRLAATWERTRGTVDFPVVELCGTETRSKWAIAAAACAMVDWRLYAMAAESLPPNAADLDNLIRLWQREAVLSQAALLLDCEGISPGDAQEAAIRRFVDQSRGGLIVTRRRRMPPRHRPVLSLDVGKPRADEQGALWRFSLAEDDGAAPSDGDLDRRVEALVGQFDLSAEQIRSTYIEALGRARGGEKDNGDGVPGAAALYGALWETCRIRARPGLADLAQHIEPRAGWDDLVLPERERQTLREIVGQVRQRGTVYGVWGFGRTSTRGQGISALFAGSSGTGKTMAAEVIAGDLDLDLFRIDLSSVISKYIGETEKNLQQVFDAAESGGAILLFDEADALFGKRSEVRDSHDRHANIEVSYLLQRMETYRGLAILTTNLRDALDTAFKRRLQFIVEFPFPDTVQRREIWRRTFPPEAPTEGLHLDRLARLNLSGGHIRNIALHAAFLAAEAGRAVTMRDLLIATRREFAKLERPLAEAETRDWLQMKGGHP